MHISKVMFTNKKNDKITKLEKELEEMHIKNSKLRKENQQFKDILHHFTHNPNLKCYIIRVGTTGEIISINGGIYKMLGYQKEDLIGNRISDITHADDHKSIKKELYQSLQYSGKVRRLTKDYAVKWVHTSIIVNSENANTLYMDWDITDIIDECKNNMQQLMNTLPHMAYIKDKNGSYCMVNKHFAKACNKDENYFYNRSSTSLTEPLFETIHTNDQSAKALSNTHTDSDFSSILLDKKWNDNISRSLKSYKYDIKNINPTQYLHFERPLFLYILKQLDKKHDYNPEDNTISDQNIPTSHISQPIFVKCEISETNMFHIIHCSSDNNLFITENTTINDLIHKDDKSMFDKYINELKDSSHPLLWQGRIENNKTIKKIRIHSWQVKQTNTLNIYSIFVDMSNEEFDNKLGIAITHYANDTIGYHEFEPNPIPKYFSDSIETLIGNKINFWLIHPDDCKTVYNCVKNTKNDEKTKAQYRIKHIQNYWVSVTTQFIPFMDGFLTITQKLHN